MAISLTFANLLLLALQLAAKFKQLFSALYFFNYPTTATWAPFTFYFFTQTLQSDYLLCNCHLVDSIFGNTSKIETPAAETLNV